MWSRPDFPQGPRHSFSRAVALPQHVSFDGVVVDAKDVSDKVLPAVVADDRSCRVERLCQPVQPLDERLLRWIARHIGHAPALVDRNPGNDAWMTGVAAQHGEPLVG
ncbi:MAG: hypothetical protein C4289_03305, partial [Chloroflexota bacterium]